MEFKVGTLIYRKVMGEPEICLVLEVEGRRATVMSISEGLPTIDIATPTFCRPATREDLSECGVDWSVRDYYLPS